MRWDAPVDDGTRGCARANRRVDTRVWDRDGAGPVGARA